MSGTTSAFLMTPNNRVVLVGDHLTLNCSSRRKSSYLHWYKDCDFCSNDALAADNAIPPYHMNNIKKGTAALVVSPVTMAESGSYTCFGDIEATGVSLQVIVLGKFPLFIGYLKK